jgi:predicted flap endonuclease-1-like 5' DNA nuclease
MSAFGLEAGVEQVAAASVETFKSIPPDARVALSRAGIATLGKLATASPQETARALEAAGLKGYSAGDVAEWTGAAKVLTKVR